MSLAFVGNHIEGLCIKNYDVFRASNNDLVAIPGELDGMYPFIDVKLSVRSQRCGIPNSEMVVVGHGRNSRSTTREGDTHGSASVGIQL